MDQEANVPADEPTGAAVARRILGGELQRLRTATGMTVEYAAKRAEMSRQTLWKIESGQARVRINRKDIGLLCELFDAPPKTRDALLALADVTRVKGWYSSFQDLLPSGFDTYLGLEQDASEILWY